MSKFLPTLVALLLLAGLGFYSYKYEQEPLSEKAVPKVALTDKAKITRVELDDKDKKQKVVLEKGKDDKWSVAEPLKAKVEDDKVDTLLTRLEKVKADRIVDGEQPGVKPDLAKYGLDKPSHEVTWTADKSQRTILIGKDSPLGSNAYVKLSDSDKVFLVNSGDLEILKKDLYTFRDKTVLKADKDQVKQVDVAKATGEKLHFSHAADGTWEIDKPFTAPGDAQVIGDMVNDLGRLKAEEFTAETTSDLKPYGLDKPELTVELVMKEDGAKKTVLFGKRKETDSSRLYAKRESEPNVYLVDATLIKALGNKPDEFRDKTIFRTGDKEITAVTVEKGVEKVIATRAKDGKWSYTSPRLQADPGPSGTQLLDKIKDLKAARFIAAADVKPDFGLAAPEYRLSVTLTAKPATPPATGAKTPPAPEEKVLVAALGKAAEGGRYLKLENDTVAVVTKDDPASALDGFMKTYRELLPIDEWNFKSIALEAAKGKKQAYEINDKGDWVKSGQKAAVSPLKEKIRGLVSTLPHLVASDWMAETSAALEADGLSEPEFKLTIKTKDGKPDTTLRLSASGGKNYLKLEGKAGIGVIGPDILARSRELAADQTPATPVPGAKPEKPAGAKAPGEKLETSAVPTRSAVVKAAAGKAPAKSVAHHAGSTASESKESKTPSALPGLAKNLKHSHR